MHAGCIAGALQDDNDRLSRLLERESRRADEADGRLRVASEQLNWAIPQVCFNLPMQARR